MLCDILVMKVVHIIWLGSTSILAFILAGYFFIEVAYRGGIMWMDSNLFRKLVDVLSMFSWLYKYPVTILCIAIFSLITSMVQLVMKLICF